MGFLEEGCNRSCAIHRENSPSSTIGNFFQELGVGLDAVGNTARARLSESAWPPGFGPVIAFFEDASIDCLLEEV